MYILHLLILLNSAPSIREFTIDDFSSQISCEQAGDLFIEAWEESSSTIKAEFDCSPLKTS